MDELLMMTILCAFLISCILIFASHVLFERMRAGSQLRLPPGRIGLPLLGESIEFILTMWKGRPESFVQERIRRYSSETFKTSVLGDPVTILYGPVGNKFLFANEAKLVKVWWPKMVSGLIISSNSEKFTAKDIDYPLLKLYGWQKHVHTVDRMAKLHVQDKWMGHQQVTVFPLAENYAFSLACRLFLSIEDDETVQSLAIPMKYLRVGFSSLPINLPWTNFGKAKQASNLIKERLKPMILKRRSSALELSSNEDDNDLLSHLMQLTDGQGEHMNEEEIADRLMAFLVAGHDTSSAIISLIFSFLADHKDIYDMVLHEQLDVAASKEPGELLQWEDIRKMKYSWNVAREVMRLYPPIPAIHRIATDDFNYDGYCIPKGSKIQMNIVSTHRDPRFYPDPHKFDPSRFDEANPLPYTYFPLGGGSRRCPGGNYARSVILTFLHNIIIRFKWEKVYANEAIIYRSSPRPIHGLPIRLHPQTRRCPSAGEPGFVDSDKS